jgi:hypothetical protein
MSIVEPFDSYRLYQSIKLHFESDSYDAVKYNFKTSANPQSFFKRRDKYFFAKLGKQLKNQRDLVEYYVANFLHDSKWVGDMINGDGENNYRQYKKVHESLTYHFQNDIDILSDFGTLDEVLSVTDSEHPIIIKELLRDNINIETVVILDKMTGFMDHANKQISETIVFPDVYRKVKKYRSFVHPNIEKCKKIVIQGFTS